MPAEFLPAQGTDPLGSRIPYRLPVGQDLLPLGLAVPDLCLERAALLCQLQEPEVHRGLEPVLGNIARPEAGPDDRDAVSPFPAVGVKSGEPILLRFLPPPQVCDLVHGKPELRVLLLELLLLLPLHLHPLPDLFVPGHEGLQPLVFGLLVCNEGELSFKLFCLHPVRFPLLCKGLLLVEEAGVSKFLLCKDFLPFCEPGPLLLFCTAGQLLLRDGFPILRHRCLKGCELLPAQPAGHGFELAGHLLEFARLFVGLLF